MIMKKILRYTSFIFVAMIIFSCTNKNVAEVQESNDKDSLLLAQRHDSIERDRKFDALGDTVFNTICYGMSISQFVDAYNVFKKTRMSKEHEEYFEFADYEFIIYKSEFTKREINNPIEEIDLWTEFFNNQLFSVRWDSWRKIQSPESTKKSLAKLVSYFEKKYGPANSKNAMIMDCVYDRLVAEWETEERKIMILYDDLIGVSRDKYMDEEYPSYKQYEVSVRFIDKTKRKAVDDYVDKILQKKAEKYFQQKKQDSINNATAL